MQFFDRDKEISVLRRIRELSVLAAQFTVITGKLYEVKRQPKEYEEELLRFKANKFMSRHPELAGYRAAFHGLTMDEM